MRNTVRDLNASQTTEVTRVPTLPEGGLIKGKTPSLSIEENISRKNKNRELPLVLGESFAGISMQTTRSESKAVLSEPTFSTDSGIDVYAEGFNLTWGEGVNPVPTRVMIFKDYRGSLKLPMPYGEVKIEESLVEKIGDDPKLEKFTRILAQAFAGKDGTYDCLLAEECLIEKRGDAQFFIDFPQGTLALWQGSIYLVDFYKNRDFSPKITTPMIFGLSLAGVDTKMKKTEVDALLGEPYRFANQDTQLYDAKSIQVTFRASGVVEEVKVLKGHQGKMTIGDKEYGLGSSFAEISPPKDDATGAKLMQTLAKTLFLKEMDKTYDCTKEEGGAQCAFGRDTKNKILRIQVGNVIFDLSDDDKRILTQVQMFNPSAS